MGELVSMHASVNYVGNSSLVVGIRVEAENVKLGTIKHTNSSFFTMVAKDDNDKPMKVPILILENEEDVKRFIEAMRMKEIKNAVKDQMDDAMSTLEVGNAKETLKNQRCQIKIRL